MKWQSYKRKWKVRERFGNFVFNLSLRYGPKILEMGQTGVDLVDWEKGEKELCIANF